MRCFEVGSVRERKLAWGKIMFTDKYHIVVETPTLTVVFHRYGAPKGHYRLWSKFRQSLIYRDLENIYDVYKYANRFEVIHFVKKVSLDSQKNTQEKQ